jgi:transcriptional regulator with XRE-family HTH domain
MSGALNGERYVAFIEALRGYRVQLGVSQVELAARLGQKQPYVSKTERRERRLDVVEFQEWAEALGVDPVEMLSALRRRWPAR